jgi:hypothetical protein
MGEDWSLTRLGIGLMGRPLKKTELVCSAGEESKPGLSFDGGEASRAASHLVRFGTGTELVGPLETTEF